MRLLFDQGTPRSAAELLRQRGHDAIHLGELGQAAAEDPDILALAARESRILVTVDGDFHEMLALSGARAPSVIRVRIEGLRGDALVKLLVPILEEFTAELKNGAMVTVQRHRVRMRKLPIDL
jgi:predicted nuclease of predicted toxin-antitoxin system